MRMMRTALWVGLFTMMIASLASANPITMPAGLAPGSTYFLAFVTAGTRDALPPSTISDYDAFVTAQADLSPDLLALRLATGFTWKAIASTATISAATHLGLITGPIYNLAGEFIASGSADLFDGSISNPINYDQYGLGCVADGVNEYCTTWTGSDQFGNTNSGLGGSYPATIGNSPAIDSSWILAGSNGEAKLNHLYAILDPTTPLTVPAAAVPEPGTISLLMGPGLILFGRGLRRRRRLATRTKTSDPAVH